MRLRIVPAMVTVAPTVAGGPEIRWLLALVVADDEHYLQVWVWSRGAPTCVLRGEGVPYADGSWLLTDGRTVRVMRSGACRCLIPDGLLSWEPDVIVGSVL